MTELNSDLVKLKKLTKTQCEDGNWNYDSYMHGMANGLILAVSCFEKEDPKFLDAPEKWLSDEIIDTEPIVPVKD